MDTSRTWVERGARFGHFTKGVIYGLIGVLALQVALGSGGRVAGQQEAAQFVGRQPFGVFLLIAIAVGLSGFALWRCLEAIQDTGHKGKSGKGLAQRFSALASGIVNAGLAVAVVQLALGHGGAGGGARSWVGKLLELPFGGIVLGLVGGGVVLAGVFQLYQAYSKRFLQDFHWSSMSPTEQRWVTRAGQVGYSARGIVFPIIGVGFLKAALNHDPGQTRGTREALLEIARSSYGPWLLGIIALGFVAFGSFMVASARYRAIPT